MKRPNFILSLDSAFKKFDQTDCINKKEIALYMALFRIWNSSYFKDVINPSRVLLMKKSRIGNATTLKSALNNLESAKVLEILERKYQFQKIPIKMLGVFDRNESITEAELQQEGDKNATESDAEMPYIIKQENNSKKKEKKRNSFFD